MITSPGFTAVPEGRFSVEGIRPITLSFGCSRPSTSNVPSTAAAPDMSYFMSSMLCDGLIEMPPESKVTPFPSRASGGASPAPVYWRAMNRGSCCEPCATASSAPIPSFLMAVRSSTVTAKPYVLPSCTARSPRYRGVQILPGSICKVRAR